MSGDEQLDAWSEAMKNRPGRNPARIPRVLAVLGELWMENPDLRLGQIISKVQLAIGTGRIDLPRLKRILTSEEQGEHGHD